MLSGGYGYGGGGEGPSGRGGYKGITLLTGNTLNKTSLRVKRALSLELGGREGGGRALLATFSARTGAQQHAAAVLLPRGHIEAWLDAEAARGAQEGGEVARQGRALGSKGAAREGRSEALLPPPLHPVPLGLALPPPPPRRCTSTSCLAARASTAARLGICQVLAQSRGDAASAVTRGTLRASAVELQRKLML